MATGWLLSCVILLVLDVLVAGFASRERTMAMVKPDGVKANHTEAIKSIIESSGFNITMEKSLQLDLKTAETFYSEHSGKPFFEDLIDFMTSGPIVAMVLEQHNAIANWRKLIGPTDPEKARSEQPNSIRALFGSSTTQNCVHGSDSQMAAAREITILFKDVEAGNYARPGHDEL